jgi:predicted MFS family arabinose efflux permease
LPPCSPASGHDIVLLALAAILLDLAVQTTLILGQHVVYQLDPRARARLNSVFIATFFAGGALGSQLGTVAHQPPGTASTDVSRRPLINGMGPGRGAP